MDYKKHIYSQADASILSGIPQDALRDWRRRDFLQHFGEQGENSRWNYSLDEIIQLAVVRCLAGNGHSIEKQLYMARHLSLAVIAEFDAANSFYASNHKREITAFRLDVPIGGWMCHTVRSFADLEELPFMQVLVVDTAKLVESLPDEIKSLMRDTADT